MKKICLCLVLAFFAYPCHARMNYTYQVGSFEIRKETNFYIMDEFTNCLFKELAVKKFYLTESGTSIQPDFIISGWMDSIPGRYEFHIIVASYTNKFNEKADDLYTEDLYGLSGTRDAAKAAAGRIVIMAGNGYLPPYRERHNYNLDHTPEASESGSPESAFILNFVDVPMRYPYGFMYNFPLAFSFDLFECGYTLFLPGTGFGIGAGTKAVDVHGPTAGSILPVILYLPVYISPGNYSYSRHDLYFKAEYGFLLPQYSYIDLSLNLILNGISFSAGWLDLPAYSYVSYNRAYYSTFYAGLKFSFGEYIIKLQEK